MFRKLNRSCITSVDGNLAPQSKSTANRKPKILRKLNRDIIEDSNYNSIQQHGSSKQQKKWKMKQKSLVLKDEIPQPPKINRIFPGISSVPKKTAIISPIRRTTVVEDKATRFKNTFVVSQRLQGISPSAFSSVLSSASALSVPSSSTSVPSSSIPSPPKGKSIKLKRNFTSITSNVFLQSPSPKTSTPNPSLTKKFINLNSQKISGKLRTSSILSKTSHGPTVVQKTIYNSGTLSTLECKKKLQEKLQACRNEKNPKFLGGNVQKKRTSVNDSKTNSNIEISTQSLAQSSAVNKSLTSPDRTRCISPVTSPVSTSLAQLNRNQNTKFSVQKDESSRSGQNDKTNLSSKVLKLIPSPAPAISGQKKHLALNACRNNFSPGGPNPRFLTSRLNLKNPSHLASKSPKLLSDPSFNKSLNDSFSLTNSTHSPRKRSLSDRSSLTNSTHSSLNKSLGDKCSSIINSLCSLPNKSLDGRSNLNSSLYSLPNKSLGGRSNLNSSTNSSLNKSLGDRANCNTSTYLPTKGNNEPGQSFNKLPSNKPGLNKYFHTQRRNSALLSTPNNNANSLELRKTNFEPRNGNFEINHSNNVQQSDGPLTASSLSSNTNDSDFQTEVDDVEMEDVSMNLPSLTALSSCIETKNLPDSKHYVFVVDTNVLMHHLNFIDELKDTPLAGCGPPHIFIPWIVINELDGLKAKDSKNRVEAMKAIRFVFAMLSSKHPRFHGQKAKLAKDIESSFGHENDDTILKFCTVLLEKTSKGKFGLISNDINLCNKAIINDINAYTPDSLFSKIKPDVEIYHDKNDPTTSTDKESEGMVVDAPAKPIKPCHQVDAIMCEAKLILKEILEPFLQESMKQAFGDMSKTFLKPAPTCLLEILGYYDKYWISVFGIIFKKSARKFFDSIRNMLTSKKGFFSDLDDAFAAVITIEKICKAVANEKPSARAQVRRISKLTDDCKALTKLEEEEKVPVVNKNQNEIAFGIFNHLWGLINHLCGMTMDFAELPHDYKYVKPAEMPSMHEFQMLISNLFPALHKIKQGMSKVVDITTATEQDEHEQDYKRLYDYLLQFVPSLQIQATPPPAERFTVQCLKDFMLNQDNRDTVRNGFMQLIEYQKKLVQVIHLPIWK